MDILDIYGLEKSRMVYDTPFPLLMVVIWAWLTFGETGRAIKSSGGPGRLLGHSPGNLLPKGLRSDKTEALFQNSLLIKD